MKSRGLSAIGVATALTLTLGSGSAIGVESNGDTRSLYSAAVADESEPVREYVELAHPVSLADALALGANTAGFIGVRFEQSGIEGEFFPAVDYPTPQFESEFLAEYGTEPAIVALIVETAADPASFDAWGSGEENLESIRSSVAVEVASIPEFVAPPSSGGTIVEEFNAARGRAQAESAQARSSSSALDGFGTQAAYEEAYWAPGYTEIYAMEVSGTARVATYNSWDGAEFQGKAARNPKLMPPNFGFEVDITLYNTTNTGSYRPFCLPLDYDTKFWAQNEKGVMTWSVYNGTGGSPGNIGAYLDHVDDLDACRSQSVTVGIGYPRNIAHENEWSDLITSIKTRRGTAAISDFSAVLQPVDDNCPGRISSYCMGLLTGVWPGGIRRESPVVNKDRSYWFPGCYSTAYPDRPQRWSSCA